MRLNKWGQYAVVVNSATYNLDITRCGVYSISGSAGGKKITAFTGGAGTWAILLFTDSNVTVDKTAAYLHGNVDFTGAAGDLLFIATYDGVTFGSAGNSQQAGTSVNTPVAALTVTGALAANGGITCDTTAFTVADTSGNVATAGTLSATGNFAINTNKFTVTASSGNTLVAGTLAVTSDVAINTNKLTVTASSGNTAIAGTLGVTGVITPTGGVAAGGGFVTTARLVHTGGIPPQLNSEGTDATPVATEVYIAEVYVPANVSVTGVSIFNGSVASGNVKVGLANSGGTVVATSASTAMSGTDAYQRVAFTAPYAALGPATYYVLYFVDNNTARYNTHTFGDFGAAKQTGQVYATGFTTITPPSTFTTGLGPLASLY